MTIKLRQQVFRGTDKFALYNYRMDTDTGVNLVDSAGSGADIEVSGTTSGIWDNAGWWTSAGDHGVRYLEGAQPELIDVLRHDRASGLSPGQTVTSILSFQILIPAAATRNNSRFVCVGGFDQPGFVMISANAVSEGAFATFNVPGEGNVTVNATAGSADVAQTVTFAFRYDVSNGGVLTVTASGYGGDEVNTDGLTRTLDQPETCVVAGYGGSLFNRVNSDGALAPQEMEADIQIADVQALRIQSGVPYEQIEQYVAERVANPREVPRIVGDWWRDFS